jgi:hypothetical protein
MVQLREPIGHKSPFSVPDYIWFELNGWSNVTDIQRIKEIIFILNFSTDK